MTDPPEDPLPDRHDAPGYFGEIWVKYPLAQIRVPLHHGVTYLVSVGLWMIMTRIAQEVFLNGGKVSMEQAHRFRGMLIGWHHRLPEILTASNVIMPIHLLLQWVILSFCMTIPARLQSVEPPCIIMQR